MTIRKQFQMYLISILSFCAGSIFTKDIVSAGLAVFVPIGTIILLNWDDAKYLERQKKTTGGTR